MNVSSSLTDDINLIILPSQKRTPPIILHIPPNIHFKLGLIAQYPEPALLRIILKHQTIPLLELKHLILAIYRPILTREHLSIRTDTEYAVVSLVFPIPFCEVVLFHLLVVAEA